MAADHRIAIAVDHRRRLSKLEGVVICRRRELDRAIHPSRRPSVVRIEEAVLQQAASSVDVSGGTGVIADVWQHRLTTPGALGVRALGDSAAPEQASLGGCHR